MQIQLGGKLAPTTIFNQQKDKEEGIGKSEMDQQDFLNLLVEQLKNQDPLNPTDNAEFMTQTTMFSQLDQMSTTNETLTTMLEMMKQQQQANNSLSSGANYIGKEIEFTTNTVTIGGDGMPNINFYLGDVPDASKSTIKVYNKNSELVAIIKPESLKKGENIIHWDGKGIGGVEVPDGTYNFIVEAVGASGEPVEVEEFGTGIVKGVKLVNGTLYFDIGDGVVSSEYVYAVKEPDKENAGGGDKED